MYRPFDSFQISGHVISVIGSGGKTSMLSFLARRLNGSVILTTSTHMYPFDGVPLIDTGMSVKDCGMNTIPGSGSGDCVAEVIAHQIQNKLQTNRVVCLGKKERSGKLADPSDAIPFEALLSYADYVLVEADGSKGLPLKAHRPFEPVIPVCSSMTVCVVGASGIGKPLGEVCHCPDLFARIAGSSLDTIVTEEHIAAVLNWEDLADCYLVNQVDSLADPGAARRLCDLIRKDAYMASLRTM